MIESTVRVYWNRALSVVVALGREYGIELDSVPGGSFLAEALQDDPDGYVSHMACVKLFDLIDERARDGSFCARFEKVLVPEALGPFEFLIYNSVDLRQGMNRLAGAAGLVGDADEIVPREVAGGVEFCFALGGKSLSWARLSTMAWMTGVTLFARRACKKRVEPTLVELPYSAPWSADGYAEFFGVEPRFGADQARLVYSLETLDHPVVGGNPTVGELLEDYARMLLARIPRAVTFVEAVRHETLKNLQIGAPTVSSVARRLAMSPRSLQRRLEAEGITFQALLDEVRLELAERYLADKGLSVAQVAELVGFAGPGAFLGAFRRWTGKTPSEYRAAQNSAAADAVHH